MYRAIEWGAQRMGQRYLRRSYRTHAVLRGSLATLDGLAKALDEATAQPGIAAVDLLVNPHGTSRKVWFDDGPADCIDVCAALRGLLDSEQRRRLRAVFSTACFGMSHNDAWLRAGFAVAVGSRGIYADGMTSLPRMLAAWAAGSTVLEAAAAANAGTAMGRQDGLAARYYRRAGREEEAAAVDSTHVVDGAGAMVLTTDPGQWRPARLPA